MKLRYLGGDEPDDYIRHSEVCGCSSFDPYAEQWDLLVDDDTGIVYSVENASELVSQ